MQNSIASSSTSNHQLENTMGVSRQGDSDNNNNKSPWDSPAQQDGVQETMQQGGIQQTHIFQFINFEISRHD